MTRKGIIAQEQYKIEQLFYKARGSYRDGRVTDCLGIIWDEAIKSQELVHSTNLTFCQDCGEVPAGATGYVNNRHGSYCTKCGRFTSFDFIEAAVLMKRELKKNEQKNPDRYITDSLMKHGQEMFIAGCIKSIVQMNIHYWPDKIRKYAKIAWLTTNPWKIKFECFLRIYLREMNIMPEDPKKEKLDYSDPIISEREIFAHPEDKTSDIPEGVTKNDGPIPMTVYEEVKHNLGKCLRKSSTHLEIWNKEHVYAFRDAYYLYKEIDKDHPDKK